ncbi:MAG: ankyrin repeat domain-containing protein [Acidobacteriota bacterium]
MTVRFLFLLLFLFVPLGIRAQNLNEELITAARKSNVEAVKTLLAKGADVNAKTEYGATPLFFACDRGNVEIVKLLLAAGADVDARDTFYKSTPTSWAVQRDQAEVVKLLVEKKPASREQTTAMAIMMGQPKTAQALLGMGEFKPESLTAWLTMSEKNGNTEIVEALKKAGAKPKPKNEYKVDAALLPSYVGTFRAGDGDIVVMSVKDGKLIATSEGRSYTSVGTAQHQFELEEAPGVTLFFNLEGEKVVGMRVKEPGNDRIYKRVEGK